MNSHRVNAKQEIMLNMKKTIMICLVLLLATLANAQPPGPPHASITIQSHSSYQGYHHSYYHHPYHHPYHHSTYYHHNPYYHHPS